MQIQIITAETVEKLQSKLDVIFCVGGGKEIVSIGSVSKIDALFILPVSYVQKEQYIPSHLR